VFPRIPMHANAEDIMEGRHFTLQVSEKDHGRRLDQFVVIQDSTSPDLKRKN